ncbi:DNA/RNA helicases, SNF2 family [hydrothermal vent metagenome]|uniref:DNA/RNA helicases, SNF2 family n=1 Tax=hydrothermal vent metagenome TaxID=652676 RepID=A0A3B1BME5_9ZZZZ
MYKLKRGDIKNWTGQNSYNRGRLYFEQGKVSNLRVDELDRDEVVLYAAVQGRNKTPYRQEIYIEGLTTGAIEIDGNCSCPVGFNCKHVVAACLEYQSNSQTASNSADLSLSWLEQFAQASQLENTFESVSNEFIAYILKASPDPSILSVQLITTRKLKKGGLGKGRKIELYNLTGYSLSSAVQTRDREIGKLIEVQNERSWGAQTYTLSGELGFLALSKMLNTGRCFWQGTQFPALQAGETRKLQFDWQKEKNGDRRLLMRIEPEAVILNTTPVLYLDTQAGAMGSVTGADFNPEQWTMLLRAPRVAASACAEFSQHLLTRLADIPLPPPQEMDALTLEPQPPVPRLYLFAELDMASGQRTHMMRLRFAYAGYELTFSPVTPVRRLLENNLLISIERDLTAENRAVETLIDAGFQITQGEQEDDMTFISLSKTSLMESAATWQHFLDEILPGLEAEGWDIAFDSDFQLQFLQVDDWEVEIESDNDWFDLRFDLEVQGKKLPLLPLIAEVLSNYEPDKLPDMLTLPLGNSQYLQLSSERIQPICQILYELYDADTLDGEGNMRMSRFDAARLTELEENCGSELRWRGGKALRELGRKLKNFKGIRKVATPRGLKASLRDYQQQGLNWLQFLRSYEFNGILADDMGLGKTVQTLAHLLLEKERKRMQLPCLIIAPTSLMSNWRREAEKFTPRLSVLILQGPERQQYFSDIDKYDLVLSTYPLLVRDHEILLAQEYYYLILDEAQVIKNPRARAAGLARKINAQHRLCLTGTPMENHLGELWALFDFLMPGFLGDNKLFTQRFRSPIEKYGDEEQRQRLVRRVTPFLLRRTKTEVAKELPQKTEIIRSVELDGKQAALYESIRLSMQKKVRDAISKKGLARSHITILDALLKLRQTCCDPQLLSLAQAKKVNVSAKLEMLMQMLPELLEEGRRILLFSQFTKMLGIIEQRLKDANISYTKLTGQTRKRDQVIEQFCQGEVDVFLISLKAGGVGLNLTEADTVIHYDPWWNPAVENQATDRAHRIGQDKAVFVYKLITENTLEEKIMAMQARKQALADGVYKKGKQGEDFKLNADDLQELFAPLSG